jgi:signal transduction histidine kinase
MTEQREQAGEETERLRRCMSDLLSLLALPAMWVGGDLAQIGQRLLDVLPAMLDVDLLYARLIDNDGSSPVEMAWTTEFMQAMTAQEIGRALLMSLGTMTSEWPQRGRTGIGGVMLSVAQTQLGMNGQAGVLVAGSRRLAFPAEAERLLLNVAGNQAAIAVKEAHLLIEQRQYAVELDKRVAQRTEELAATNRALAEEIAERKRAEDELRRNAAFLAQAQRLTLTGSTWWNVSTGEIIWSDETYRLIEYPITTKPTVAMTMERCHPEDFPRVREMVRRAAAEGTDLDFEHRLVMPNGSVKHVHIVLQNVGLEPSKPEFVGAVTDITERKQSEERLRRSEMLLAAGERISLTGTFSWRVDTDEILFSDELNRIFEFDADDVVTFDRVAERIYPEDLPMLAQMIREARSGREMPEYELRVRGLDDKPKYMRVVGRVVRQRDGRIECLGAVQDVTQRRLAEQSRDEMRSELAHVARSMSLGALTASIAHEVNQPLSGIITNAGTCLRMLGSDPPNVAGAIETARRTIRDGKRAAEVISRLRALFQKKPAVIEPIDLNEVTKEVVTLLWHDLQRARVQLNLELAEDLPPVAGDRVQLQQVIVNLLRNAADAMMSVDERARHLLIRTASHEDEDVLMSVRDTGEGFESGDAERLFNAFYTTKKEGMGIGLSVSRSIIQSHKGRIWAEANDGPGTTMIFCVPQSRATSDGASRLPDPRNYTA